MAFTVEDGTGLAAANSYVSVADADTYFADRGITGWTGTDTVKEQALVKATDYIEKRFGDKFLGRKEFPTTQFLAFPRVDLYDRDAQKIEGVPTKLEYATAEYALIALTETLAPNPTVDATGKSVGRTKVGPIEVEYSEGSGLPFLLRPYPAADLLLKDFLAAGGGGVIRA